MKTLVKNLVRQARVMSSDDPTFVHAPRGAFVETMWSDEQRDKLGLDRDDYLAALRQAWKHFYKPPNGEDADAFSDAAAWRSHTKGK